MNSKGLATISFDVANGRPEFRRKKAQAARARLEQEMVRLRDKGERLKEEFTGQYEAWTSLPVEGVMRPLAIEEDLRDARLVKWAALLVAVLEVALSVFIALVYAVNPFFLVGLTLVAIFAVKAGLIATWRNHQQPQATKRRLRNWVIVPSLLVTLAAIAVLVLARTAGPFALLLLPLINAALCVLSLGCLGLGAGLFTLSYVLVWSRHAEARFNAVEREAIETYRVLKQVEQVEQELLKPRTIAAEQRSVPVVAGEKGVRAQGGKGAQFMSLDDARVKRAQPLARHGYGVQGMLLPLLLAGAVGLSGCEGGDSKGQAGAVAAQKATVMEIVVYVDWSMSGSEGPLAESAQAVVKALPRVIAEQRATRLTIRQFGANGWEASEVKSVELPSRGGTEQGEVPNLFGNIAEAQAGAAKEEYQRQLGERLKGVTADLFLPPVGTPEPHCTDVQGVLRRIGESAGEARQLAILISDLHDTCAKRLQPVTAQEAALLVLLLPEKARESGAELAHVQFERRREQAVQIYSGAVVIPHFGDVVQAARAAVGKAGWARGD